MPAATSISTTLDPTAAAKVRIFLFFNGVSFIFTVLANARPDAFVFLSLFLVLDFSSRWKMGAVEIVAAGENVQTKEGLKVRASHRPGLLQWRPFAFPLWAV